MNRTSSNTSGLFVGQKDYTSLPIQQSQIEKGIRSGPGSVIDDKQQAEKILNARLTNYQVQPPGVRGGAQREGPMAGTGQLNSKSGAGPQGSYQSGAAKGGQVRRIYRPNSQANAGGLGGRSSGLDARPHRIMALQHLDRKEDSPDKVYREAPAIKDSPYKQQYERIHQQLLGEADGPYTAKVNEKPYIRRGQSGSRMTAMCFKEYSRLEPMCEAESFQSQPHQVIVGTGPMAKIEQEKWLGTDFPDRNLALKKQHLKSIATEESLDDWYAQSLGIPYDKFLKQKKMLQSIMQDAKKKRSYNKSEHLQVAKAKKAAAKIQVDQGQGNIPYDSTFVRTEETQRRSRPKTSQMSGPPKVSPKVGVTRVAPDFNQMIKNARGYSNYIIQDPGELKPCIYSAFGKAKSEVVSYDEPSPRASRMQRRETYKGPQYVDNSIHFRSSMNATKMTVSSLALRSQSVNQGKDIERRALINEIGGFNSKKLLDTYFKQMKDRERIRRSTPAQKKGPNQEFIQSQKKKLRDLMLRNAELEYNRGRKREASFKQRNQRPQQSSTQRKDDEVNVEAIDLKQAKSGSMMESGEQQPSVAQTHGQQLDSDAIRSAEYCPQSATNDQRQGTEEQAQSMISSKLNNKVNSVGHSRISSRFHPASNWSTQLKMSAENQGQNIDGDPSHIKIRQDNSPTSAAGQGIYSQMGCKDGEKDDMQEMVGQFGKTNLMKFWITDQQTLLDEVQIEEDLGTSSKQNNANTMQNDSSHNWYLQDKRFGEQQLANCIPKYQQETISQALDDVSHMQQIQSFNPLLSSNENAFLSVNKALKGIEMSSQYHKYIARVMQEKYFNNQKKETIDRMLGKKGARWVKIKSNPMGTSLSKKGSTSTLLPPSEPQSQRNAKQQSRCLPDSDSELHHYILRQIELDNLRDIEDPFVVLNVDNRVNRINKKPRVAKPDEKYRKQKLDFQDSQFWFLKGYDHAEGNEMDSAIDSYRQAIRLNTDHSEAMMNLAAQYEAQQRYDVATKWYNLAIKLNPALIDAYFGYALCQFKGGKPQDAAERLSIAIDQLNNEDIEDRSKRHKIYFRYLRALCYKVMGEFVKSQKDYKDILGAFELEEGSKFANYIFAMILMPIETNRKKLLEYVEGFKGILDLFEGKKNRKILSHHYLEYIDKNHVYIGDNQNKKWLDKKIPDIIRILRKRSFFKRFSLPRVCEMLEQMELRLVKEKDILFFQKDQVYVIISGNILMKNHDQQIHLPLTCAKFGEGDVLNFLQEKTALFNSLETWFFAQVESEVAIFDRAYFEKVWDEDIMTEKLMLQSSLTASQPLFSDLSELTIMMLVSEVFQHKKFKKGDIILEQSRYSPTNTYYRQYYEIRLSKFVKELRAKRTKQEVGAAMARSPGKAFGAQKALALNKESSVRDRKEIHKDIEDIEKYGRVAQKFNFKSRKKAHLEKELGVFQEEPRGKAKAGEAKPTAQEEGDEGMSSDQNKDQDGFGQAGPPETYASKTSLHDASQMLSEDGSQISKTQNGLYFITRGYCVVRNHDDLYCSKTLKHGDFFGESDLLKCIGYQFFGEIVAESDDVECWFIPSDQFWKIPLFEQVHMKELALKRRDILMLSFEYSRRYKVDMKEYASYYA